MNNKLKIKGQLLFSDFVFKIYNYYLVLFDNFLKDILLPYNVNDNFIICILIRGIYIIEKIFIYNIYIEKINTENLQNVSKKLIDLYFKFIEQLIVINSNINLAIRDAEIFIYKKFINKTINDFNILTEIEIKCINIIKLNNLLLTKNIYKFIQNEINITINNNSNNNNNNNNIKHININELLNYNIKLNQLVKNL